MEVLQKLTKIHPIVAKTMLNKEDFLAYKCGLCLYEYNVMKNEKSILDTQYPSAKYHIELLNFIH